MNNLPKEEFCGILPIDKPQGITSHDAVNAVRRIYGTKKVGHTGTLDPMATGVLVMLIGRAAKAADFVSGGIKKYRAGLRLGLTTDTEDTTGEPLTTSESIPSEAEVRAVIPNFVGNILQCPPMYSALKVGGQRLVDLARRGITVEREKREITVYSIDVTATNSPCEYILDVVCSKGTYIRTLCADIGEALGCGGAMCSLVRTENSGFALDLAISLDSLKELSGQKEALSALLRPTESVFADCPKVVLSDFFSKLAHSGLEIYQHKIKTEYKIGTRIRLCDKNGFFAVGEVCDYMDGSAIKPIKQF